ncbi:MAG: GMC oxidoreductase [Gaiellales bacterium]
MQHAPVVRLEQQEAGGPVTAAVVAGPGGRELRLLARTYVVAAGGIETARLLLASDGRSTGGIGNSGDALGRHYMIHPVAEVASVRLAPGLDVRGVANFARASDGVWVRRMMRLSDAAQRRHQLRNAAFALWYPDPRDPSHGDGLLSAFALVRQGLTRTGGFKATGIHRRYAEGGPTPAHLANIARDLPDIARYGARWVRDRWLAGRTLPSFTALPASGSYRLRFDAEQSPEPENRVVLSPACDSFGVRRAALQHRVGRDDRESLVRSLQLVAAEIECSGRGRVILPPDVQLTEELIFGDGTHQLGTARMSATPRTGVVDAHCRVHDCANLHLAGSSVFPTGGMAGPTMTIVALALRLADRLAREHKALLAAEPT